MDVTLLYDNSHPGISHTQLHKGDKVLGNIHKQLNQCFAIMNIDAFQVLNSKVAYHKIANLVHFHKEKNLS